LDANTVILNNICFFKLEESSQNNYNKAAFFRDIHAFGTPTGIYLQKIYNTPVDLDNSSSPILDAITLNNLNNVNKMVQNDPNNFDHILIYITFEDSTEAFNMACNIDNMAFSYSNGPILANLTNIESLPDPSDFILLDSKQFSLQHFSHFQKKPTSFATLPITNFTNFSPTPFFPKNQNSAITSSTFTKNPNVVHSNASNDNISFRNSNRDSGHNNNHNTNGFGRYGSRTSNHSGYNNNHNHNNNNNNNGYHNHRNNHHNHNNYNNNGNNHNNNGNNTTTNNNNPNSQYNDHTYHHPSY